MHTEITERPALRVATVRHIGPYDRIGDAFARLERVAAAAGLLSPSATLVAIYHDDPEVVASAELRSDAGIELGPAATLPTALGEVTVPAGRYLLGRHIGPYSGLPGAWAHLKREWLQHSGHRRAEGVSYEVYPNNPMTAPPHELITDIYIPLV
ncbi:MAG: GyrI-like domain-containing protein [bacterium]